MKSAVQHKNPVERPRHPNGAAPLRATRAGHFSPAQHGRDAPQYAAWAVIALSVAAPLLAYWVRAANVAETTGRPGPSPQAVRDVRTPAPASAAAQDVLPDAPPTQNLARGAAAAAVPLEATAPAERPLPAPRRALATGGAVAPPVVLAAPNIPAVGEGPVRTPPASAAPPAGAIPTATGGAARLAGGPHRASPLSALPPAADVRPVVIAADGELDRLLADAWGLIERGDYGPARTRLEKARKRNHDDIRADFSLGLLDALVVRDWLVAEKRFEACLRRDPKCVAVLNNLAIAEVHNRRPTDAMKRWKAILELGAATADVVQNLGRVRHLIQEGQMPKNAAVTKAADELYAQAAIAAAATWQSQVGFRVMPLPVPDGPHIGFTKDAWRMNDSSWSGPQAAAGKSKAAPAAATYPAATYPAATYPAATYPTPVFPGAPYPAPLVPGMQSPLDPRLQHMNAYGSPGGYPSGTAAPAVSGRR